MLIYLLSMVTSDGTFRYSSDFGYNDPTAPGYFEARIRDVAQFTVTLSADPNRAAPQVAAGKVTLKDEDGALRAQFLALGIAGFTATLQVIDAAQGGGGDYATASTIGVFKMAEPAYDATTVTITFQDQTQDLGVPVGRTTFAGNNSLPAGTEGTAGDVGGQYKPVAYGRVRMIAPPQVNSSRAVDQLHDAQANQILAVRAGGVAWTVGAARTFANIDNATDPAAGVVDYFMGDATHGAYGRRRAAATANQQGPFTYDIEGDARGGTWRSTVADIAAELVTQRLAAALATTAGDITALNSAAAGVVGVWNRDNMTVAQALGYLCPSANAKYWVDTTGFRIAQLAAPSGSPVANFRRFALNVTRSTADVDIGRGWRVLPPDVPVVWKVNVKYQRFWTTQTQGLDANIDQALRGQLQNEWRTATASDSAVLTTYPAAVELTVTTALDSKSDADALAASLLTLLKVRRDTLQIPAQLATDVSALIGLTSVVKVYDILDYGSTGRLMRVLGRSVYDQRSGAATFKLWG